MSDTQTVTLSPKQALRELLASLSSAKGFQDFLSARLADDVQGVVAPRYRLGKPELIRSLIDFMAMASGGSVSQLSVLEEGRSACARVLLSPRKLDLTGGGTIDLQSVPVFEWSVWLELHDSGLIKQLTLVGDGLTPAMAMGRRLAKPKA
jgi:hypothetical protein